MDNNFYNILQTFKRLDEGMTKEAMWQDAERMTREQFCDKWGDEHGEFWDNIMGEMDEGSMASAEQHSSGPKFTGYWKGTDAGTPGKHMVGASECAEEPVSLTDKLRARWEKTKQEKGLAEAGANNPAQAGGAGEVKDPVAAAKEINAVQGNVNKLKSAGVPIANVSQAVKTVLKDPTDPATPQTPQDKKTGMAFGQTLQNVLAHGKPSDVNQVVQAIKQAGMGQD